MDLFVEDLVHFMALINIYGLYQEHVELWDSFLGRSFFNQQDEILGGDLNLSLGVVEVWGLRASPEPFTYFFFHVVEQISLIDIDPVKLSPLWRNRRTRDERIAKRLDCFLILEKLVNSLDSIRKWLACRGESNHNHILFEAKGKYLKSPIPFKLNHVGLKD